MIVKDLMVIRKKIQHILIDKDMTLTQLEKAIGMTSGNLSRKLYGKTGLKIDELSRIVDYLGYKLEIEIKESVQ